MKNLLVVLAISMAAAAAQATVIDCSGATNEGSAKNIIGVHTQVESGVLKYSVTPALAPVVPSQVSLDIVKVIPMMPLYTVIAEKNLLAVDGDYTKLTLAINTGNPSGDNTATVSIEKTSLRGQPSAVLGTLKCSIQN